MSVNGLPKVLVHSLEISNDFIGCFPDENGLKDVFMFYGRISRWNQSDPSENALNLMIITFIGYTQIREKYIPRRKLCEIVTMHSQARKPLQQPKADSQEELSP